MMKQPLNILHLEDSDDDAMLIKTQLVAAGLSPEIQLAQSRDAFIYALDQHQFDLILSDGSIPGFDGITALETARIYSPGIPFIFVSGHPLKQALTGMKMLGRTEYVPKEALAQLPTTIEQVLSQAEVHYPLIDIIDNCYPNPTTYLINAIQALSLARDLDTILSIVRHAARQLTSADGATFVLRENEQCYYAEEDAISPLWKGKRFPMSACISGWVMLNGKSAVIDDIYTDDRIPADAYRPTFVKSLVMVPIRPEAPIGAIGNYWAQPHLATPDEVKLIQLLANSTAIAMENVQLQQQLELRVQQRTGELERLNKELEAFSYSISHDLRAPLRHIDGFSQLLLEYSDQLNDTGQDYLNRINTACSRMNDLIDDMIRLSKINQANLSISVVNLSELARIITMELQAASPEQHVNIDIADEIIAEAADASLVQIALENLFNNAWKYSSTQAQAKIRFDYITNADKQKIYYIQDNGVGFDMAYASKLFAPFQRLHRDSEFSGSGIGLATVQRVIHRHGGRIWAKSNPGEGATFFFTLTVEEVGEDD